MVDASNDPPLLIFPGDLPMEEGGETVDSPSNRVRKGVGKHTKRLSPPSGNGGNGTNRQAIDTPPLPEETPVRYSPMVTDQEEFGKTLDEFLFNFTGMEQNGGAAAPLVHPEPPPVARSKPGEWQDQSPGPSSAEPSENASPPKLECQDVGKAYNAKYKVDARKQLKLPHRGGLKLKKGEKKLLTEELKHREPDSKIKERLAMFERNMKLLHSLEHLMVRVEDVLKHPLRLFVDSLT